MPHCNLSRLRWLAPFSALCVLLTATPSRGGEISFLFEAMPAPITEMLRFDGAPTDPLEGINIDIDWVGGRDTPANDGALGDCIDCRFDFATGPFLGGDITGWEFEGTGMLTIVGGVDFSGDGDLDDPGDIAGGTTLLSGEFVEDLRVDDRVSSTPDLIFGSTITPILYRHADALTGIFGMESGLYEGELILNFETVDANAPGPFVSRDIRESAIFNTSESPVAAPATWMLLLAGGAVLPWVARCRRCRGRLPSSE